MTTDVAGDAQGVAELVGRGVLAVVVKAHPEGQAKLRAQAAIEDFRAALHDDLNSSAALAAIFELMSAVNRIGPTSTDAANVTRPVAAEGPFE